MMEIDPTYIADKLTNPLRRLRCPSCGSTVVVEPVSSPAGLRRVDASCAYFDHYKQRIEIRDGEPPRTIERPDLSKLKGDEPFNPRTPVKVRCAVSGCHALAHGTLCELHLRKWRVSTGGLSASAWAKQAAGSKGSPSRGKRPAWAGK